MQGDLFRGHLLVMQSIHLLACYIMTWQTFSGWKHTHNPRSNQWFNLSRWDIFVQDFISPFIFLEKQIFFSSPPLFFFVFCLSQVLGFPGEVSRCDLLQACLLTLSAFTAEAKVCIWSNMKGPTKQWPCFCANPIFSVNSHPISPGKTSPVLSLKRGL